MVIESIPIVDFAEYKTNPKKVAQNVFDACKSIGFFYIINHGLPQNKIDRAFELASSYTMTNQRFSSDLYSLE